ncbi:MAG: hypothetical protein U1E66_08540 [Rhodospirillales bacterium]
MNLTVKEMMAASVPYSVSVSACYMFGYWGTFKINPLEFIGFADLAKLAVYPFVASFVFMLTGMLIAHISSAHVFPVGGGSNSKIGVFGSTGGGASRLTP